MAVNKNFVVKNGLEVNTSLILADANTNKVGVGSTAPRFELDVAGGIGATDFYLSGIGTFANELNVGTDGSVLTALGVGGSVGVGTALPAYLLDIRSATTTGTTALYVQGDVQITGDLSVDDITFDDASVNNLTVIEALNVTSPGISTFGGYVDINDNVDISGTLNVGGATTLGGYVDINSAADFSSTVNISGITTVGGYADFNSDVDISGTLNVTGITTLSDLNVTGIATIATVDINAGDIEVSNVDTANLNVTGIATIATISVVGAELTNLNVTGITTLGSVQVSSGIVTATTGIVTYYGDGSQLDGVIGGIGINTEGGLVGFGITYLHLFGAGVSTTFYEQSVGIATIFLEGGGGGGSVSISSVAPLSPSNGDLWYNIDYGRTFVYYDEVALGIGSTAVWVDSAPFNQGGLYINKYGDNMFAGLGVTVGSLTNPSVYFNGYTNSGFYSPAANQFGIVVSGTEKLNVNADGINVIGVATATTFNGSGSGLTGVSTNFVSAIGIQSGGTVIGAGITQLNFIGAGNTFAVNGTTVDISISGGGGGGGGSGLFNTGITSAVGYLVTGSMATAYTATDAAVIHSIHITNIDGTNSADISGQLYGEYSIAYTVPVPAGSSVELLKQPKVLNAGDTIQLEASATNDLHATISIEPQAGSTAFIGVGTDITSAATYIDLWTATADSVLQGILLSNDDGGADVKANVVWTDGSNNIQGYFAYEMIIPADATVEVLEQPKFLPSGYKVRVQGNQANRLEAILSAKTSA